MPTITIKLPSFKQVREAVTNVPAKTREVAENVRERRGFSQAESLLDGFATQVRDNSRIVATKTVDFADRIGIHVE